MKTCKKCGDPKLLDGFYSDKSRPDGKHPYCKECKKADAKRYVKENYEKVYQRVQQWKQENRVKDRAYKAAWKKRNPEKVNANRKYDKDYPPRWRAANPEKSRNIVNRRRAKIRNLPATLTVREWNQILELFDNSCAYCGELGELHQDHFIPVALDGAYVMGNIIPACPFCNQSKNATHPKEWIPDRYEELAQKISSLEFYSEVT